jgi:hypothetical protein
MNKMIVEYIRRLLKRLEGSLTVEHVMLLLYIWLTIEL